MRTRTETLRDFFFAERSAVGFGWLRIGWAGTVLLHQTMKVQDIVRYYGSAGIIPLELRGSTLRQAWRLSIFEGITEPNAVLLVYLLHLVLLACMLVGFWPRISTILSVALLFSFHEINPLPLGGGDTVFRVLGYLLMISPGIHAMSVSRIPEQWKEWKRSGSLLPPITMPVWPARLLLWQIIVIYTCSIWTKLTGTMWYDGTAVEVAANHEHFSRFPGLLPRMLPGFSMVMGIFTLVFEAAWLFFLVPRQAFEQTIFKNKARFKRWMLAWGVFFHGGIFIFFEVGSFSFAMLTSYFGLLDGDDLDAMRRWKNRKWRGKITVLHDGECGLCRRTMFALTLMDWLRRLKKVDIHDADARKAVAPDLTFKELDKALHIELPDGSTYKAFDAFRVIARHIPPLWPLWPLLYLPGAKVVGNWIYEKIAERRRKCTHEDCGA